MFILNRIIGNGWFDLTGSFQVASTIPFKKSSMPIEQYGINELVVLAIFTLLAIGTFLYMRKKDIGQWSLGKSKKIKIIERTRVSTRSSILLIQYNNRSFLLGQTADSIALIAEVDDAG